MLTIRHFLSKIMCGYLYSSPAMCLGLSSFYFKALSIVLRPNRDTNTYLDLNHFRPWNTWHTLWGGWLWAKHFQKATKELNLVVVMFFPDSFLIRSEPLFSSWNSLFDQKPFTVTYIPPPAHSSLFFFIYSALYLLHTRNGTWLEMTQHLYQIPLWIGTWSWWCLFRFAFLIRVEPLFVSKNGYFDLFGHGSP